MYGSLVENQADLIQISSDISKLSRGKECNLRDAPSHGYYVSLGRKAVAGTFQKWDPSVQIRVGPLMILSGNH